MAIGISRITLEVSKKEKNAFKKKCREEGLDMSKLIRKWVKEFIKAGK